MNIYLYRAALYCEDCDEKIKKRLGYSHEGMDETEYDSDEYPKGPYPDGGGEADSPQHCDACELFLENALTGDGEDYVREKLAERDGREEILDEWAYYYDWLRPEEWDDDRSVV